MDVTIELDEELLAKLDALASESGRSRDWIATQAIDTYVALNAWQVAQIKEGIAQADRGEFATEAEIDAVFDEIRLLAERQRGHDRR